MEASSDSNDTGSGPRWQPLPEGTCAVAICSFRGTDVIPPHGIDIDLGDVVFLVGELEGWYRGYAKSRRSVVGIFPGNHVRLKPAPATSACPAATSRVSATSNTTPTSCSTLSRGSVTSASPDAREQREQKESEGGEGKGGDEVAEEIVEVVREWDEHWKRIYADGGSSAYQFEVIRRGMLDLMDGRKALITGPLTQDQLRELRLRLTRKIDWGNRRLGLDLVPRIGFERACPEALGAVELYNVHVRSVENGDALRGSGTLRKRRRSVRACARRSLPYHLLLSVRDFSTPLNDDCEIYFSLFDGGRGAFITERFMVQFRRDGLSNFVDKLQCQGLTVFEDLGVGDLSKELFLVVHVIRVGRMFYSESASAKKSAHLYKRPFAGGVLNIGDVVNPSVVRAEAPEEGDDGETPLPSASFLEEDRELSFKLFSCDERDYFQLHELLIRRQLSKVSPLSGSAGAHSVVVTLKLLCGDLQHIRLENPVLFTSKAIISSASSLVITKKLGFPDVIMPGDVRNDLYLTLESGDFEKSGKTTGKNIEVTLLVLDVPSEGVGPVPPASYIHVCNGTGLVDEYQSVILYHANCPKWHETIRLSVPIERFPSTHLRLEFRHCSTKEKNEKKLFGFSYVRLMDEEGTTLKDGAHELFVYKCEDRNKLRDPRAYLALPSHQSTSPGKDEKDKDKESQKEKEGKGKERDSKELKEKEAWGSSQAFVRNAKEVLNVSTLLVSTKLTQNMDLVSLLKWKQQPEKVRETLMSVAHLSGEEVVKFLQDVLDVLFAMFLSEEGESNDNSGNVFIVLVNIFSMLEDPKFEHFKPVIDQYIANHFAAALVYKGLLSSVAHYARVLHTAPKLSFKQIQKCFETLEYTFKFVVQSHVLFTRASGGELNDSLARDVQGVFAGITEMMSPCPRCTTGIGAPAVCAGAPHAETDHVPVKAAALYNLSRLYSQLLRAMAPLDVTRLVVALLGAIPLRDSIHPLSPAKLTALHHLAQSPLFADAPSRRLILPEICKHLRHHLGLREELKLCTDLLGDILSFLYARFLHAPNSVHDDIEILAVATLDKLVQSVLVLERRSAIVGNLVACMVGLLQLMGTFHYNRLWDGYGERASLKELLGRVLYVFRDLVRQDVFPPEWLTMKLLTDSVLLRALAELAQPLALHFLHKYSFDADLWSQYFTLATAFLTQPGLQLERFRETKADGIRRRYGDMRLRMGDQILTMWAELGEHKAAFLPDIVGPFLEITLVPEPRLRVATLALFYDLLAVEQASAGHFRSVEAELIDRLDELVAAAKGDDHYRRLFHKILMERLEEANPSWKAAGVSFVEAVTVLLERLLDYRSVLQGEENRDKRMATTVNLLEFYQTEVRRREMYLRYVYKLHDLHVSAENFVEAGFTLLLHSQMLSWRPDDGARLPPEHGQPAQTELERKEALSLQVIEYFDAGKLWEQGIPLCKELSDIYETQLLDYDKLAKLLKTQATFFDNILKEHRPEPEYFRVAFYGTGFPLFVKNKEFVYRGQEYERLATFSQRLLAEWPSVEVLKQMTPPDDSFLSSGGQFLQICSVKPRPAIPRNALFANAARHGRHIAEPIQSYYNVNNVTSFHFDRRLKKEKEKDGDVEENEFKHMWIERTTLTTAAPLPGILRWFEVVHRHVEELTPVRFAVEKMEDVNRTLAALVAQFANGGGAEPGRPVNVNPLSMRLQGMLDAAVMGGLPKYRDAFFTSQFLESADAESLAHVARLHAAILEQMSVLEEALALHGRLAPTGVQPLHKRLLECFAQMKSAVQNDFNYSPATRNKFGGAKPGEAGPRDSFRKTTSGSSIVYTPLPPVPRQANSLRKPATGRDLVSASSLSLSNRSSTSSTGYGHLVGSIFDDHQEQLHMPPSAAPPPPPTRPLPPSDDDEDFYAKPDESKVNMLLRTYSSGLQLDGVDGSATASPPPIPNRSSKRQFLPRGHNSASATASNASTASVASSNEPPGSKRSSSPPPQPASSEYILMPPSRVRELSADAEKAAAPSGFGSFSAVTNESYFVMEGVQEALLLGPPLPPKSVGHAGEGATPPQLPRRLLKHDTYGITGKSPLTPKNSGGTSRASTPPAPPTPTKTPPPVPPKPRSNSINNLVGGGIDDYELLPPTCATPTSPSYEERFEQTSNTDSALAKEGSDEVTPPANGAVKMRATGGESEGCGEGARVSSTSTGSNGSGERRKTNKEFYQLPGKANYANRAEARLEEQPPP